MLPFIVKSLDVITGEGAFVALAEDTGLVPSAHVATHNRLNHL